MTLSTGSPRYSQSDEQSYILQALEGIQAGKVLDIGAWNATTFSNSRALIEIGWSAVLVEPSPGPLNQLIKDYRDNDDVTLIGAVVLPRGIVDSDFRLRPMWISEDGVSTTEEAEYRKWRSHATFLRKLLVPGLSLESLYQQFGSFDFISIDTEGTSVDLLEDLMARNAHARHILPTCICVEHNNRQDAVWFSTRGKYETVYANPENLVLKRLAE